MRAEDQDEVIAFLADPATHGGRAVRHIQTHAAHIFLAGDRALKLKRAVRYSYLDFSTAERRHAACAAELDLNRRTAPDLYLALRFVGRETNGRLAFDSGRPVDWLVEMRRFPDDALLGRIAAGGELPAPLVRDLADAIAAFHAGAERHPAAGGAAAMAAIIDGNRTSMAEARGFDPAAVARLHAESRASLDRLAPLLDRRAGAGFVRHCHGDLHMANICVVDGRPLLFDCIEFDPALAIIDTLYDLSFLLMDLWHHGQRAAAAVLMNRYCDISGEGAGLEALPLFLSMRAAVRAHVTMTMAGAAGNAADPAARTQAEDYLAAALAFLRPAPARLVAVGGLSGTGKSTVALALSPLVGAPPGARVLRSDVLRKRLAGVPPETRLPPERYTPAASAEVYRTLVAEAAMLLRAGVTTIADAVFGDPAERRAIAAAAGSAPFTGLWLEAGADVLRRRVGARAATAADASDATVSVVERQLGADIGDLGGWHRLAAGGTIGDMVESAMHCLDAGAARCR